jgi:hypothetical protein
MSTVLLKFCYIGLLYVHGSVEVMLHWVIVSTFLLKLWYTGLLYVNVADEAMVHWITICQHFC